MMRIFFSQKTFEHFRSCPLEELEEEIARISIRMRLQGTPYTTAERQSYQEQLDHLTVLKYINQLRKGKINMKDFQTKIELTDIT